MFFYRLAVNKSCSVTSSHIHTVQRQACNDAELWGFVK